MLTAVGKFAIKREHQAGIDTMVLISHYRSKVTPRRAGDQISCDQDSVGHLQFFSDAPLGVIAQLDAATRWFSYEPNGLIIDFEDETNDVYFIGEGLVRVVIRAPNGKERLLGELGAGCFFGEMSAIDDSGRSANVTALTKTRVCILSGAAFLDAIHASPRTCRRLLRLLSERIRAANTRLLEDAAMPGRLRLIAELLRMSVDHGVSAERAIRPPPLEHDLASRIGVRREAVSRSIADLLRRRQIERRPDALVLREPATLQRMIDEHFEDERAIAMSTPSLADAVGKTPAGNG